MNDKQIQDKEMTFKQRAWLKEYIETKNATEAAMRVYDCKNRDSAKVIGWENLTKLNYSEIMEEAGITDANLIQTLREGIESTKTVSAINTSKDADSKTMDFIDVPDYAIRHKYLETALRLKKRLNDTDPRFPTVNVNVIAETLQAIILSNDSIKSKDGNSNKGNGKSILQE